MASSDTFLLDFEAYRPPAELNLQLGYDEQMDMACDVFGQEQVDFMSRILQKSAISPESFLPPATLEHPLELNIEKAKQEAELVMFGAVDGLLAKTGIRPDQIDIVITACSCFNAVPSLASMVVNKFKFRDDVEAYHLGGMGCSSGVTAPGMAAKLLKSMPKGGYALVINHENVTTQLYPGTEREFLVTNVIFRLGGAACLLTNAASEKRRAKYVLKHCLRTHTGADDAAFSCMSVKLDPFKVPGVFLPPPATLADVTKKALTVNVTRLAPLVMPISEKVRFAKHWIDGLRGRPVKPFRPNFTKCFQHASIHAGGRVVIESVGGAMGLPIYYQEPAMNTLYYYGNVSSASVWYTQGWTETVRGVKKGDLSWHIGLGAGFEANSAVWCALRDIKVTHSAWAHVLGGREGEAADIFRRCAAGEAPFTLRPHVSNVKARTASPDAAEGEATAAPLTPSPAEPPARQLHATLPPHTLYPYSHSTSHVQLPQASS